MYPLAIFATTSACLAAPPSVTPAVFYTQSYAPIDVSVPLTRLFAALPLATLFLLPGGLRLPVIPAATAALTVSTLVAFLAYGMHAEQVASGTLKGAVIGFFPVNWIDTNAIWMHDLIKASTHSAVLRRAIGRISDDPRAQAILVACCFEALLDGFTGDRSPVAIFGMMLIELCHVHLTNDGYWVALFAWARSMATRLFRALGPRNMVEDDQLRTNANRFRQAEELDLIVRAFLGQRTLEDNFALFQAVKVTIGPVYNTADVDGDPHVQARGVLVEREDAELGSVPKYAVCSCLSVTPGVLRRWPHYRSTGEKILSSLPGKSAQGFPSIRGSCATSDR